MSNQTARCTITYGRKSCEPFQSGIEGARCALNEGHAGRHLVRIVVQFGETHEEDILGDFWFEKTVVEPSPPQITAEEMQSIYNDTIGKLYEPFMSELSKKGK